MRADSAVEPTKSGGRGSEACCFPSFLAHPLLFLAFSSTSAEGAAHPAGCNIKGISR
jgi:hypothetical protein